MWLLIMLQQEQWLPRYNLAATLVEFMLSITLLAIISINVVPRFFQSMMFKQQVFLQQVMNSLAYIQSVAIGSGCHTGVSISPNIITFNLRQNCTAGAFNQSIFDPSNNSNVFSIMVPSNILISSINFPIYFDANGLSHLMSTGVVIDAIININGYSINVIGNTGLISR